MTADTSRTVDLHLHLPIGRCASKQVKWNAGRAAVALRYKRATCRRYVRPRKSLAQQVAVQVERPSNKA